MKVLDSSGTLKEGAEICRVRFPKGHRYVDVNPHIALSIAAADASGWATQPLANMLGMTILYVRSIVLPRFDRLFR
jgi:hypothetical protein